MKRITFVDKVPGAQVTDVDMNAIKLAINSFVFTEDFVLDNKVGRLEWEVEGGGTVEALSPLGLKLNTTAVQYNNLYLSGMMSAGIGKFNEIDTITYLITLPTAADHGFYFGLQQLGQSQYGYDQAIAFDYTGTVLKCVCATSSGNKTEVNTAYTFTANVPVSLSIRCLTNEVRFYINGVQVASITTTIPTQTANYFAMMKYTTLIAAIKTMNVHKVIIKYK